MIAIARDPHQQPDRPAKLKKRRVWPPQPWLPQGTPQTVKEARRWLKDAGWTIDESGIPGFRIVRFDRGRQRACGLGQTVTCSHIQPPGFHNEEPHIC
jgi:hypothetical protein